LSTRRVSARACGSAICLSCFTSRLPPARSRIVICYSKNPVKLPFLNVELPLKAFFVLGPLVFLIVHAYVLQHFVLLAGKIGAFQTELDAQIGRDNVKTEVRRQLPSNIFVQSLAGPRDVREGPIGFLLRLVIRISLIAGPIALLVLFQLQFLPYYSEWITNPKNSPRRLKGLAGAV